MSKVRHNYELEEEKWVRFGETADKLCASLEWKGNMIRVNA